MGDRIFRLGAARGVNVSVLESFLSDFFKNGEVDETPAVAEFHEMDTKRFFFGLPEPHF